MAPLFALAAAVLFGASNNVARQGLNHLDSQSGTVVTISTTAVCFLLVSPWWMRAEDWYSPGVWIFAVGGLVHPIFSRLMAYEANRRVGPTVAAAFDGTAPLFAAGMAIAALGEQLTLPIAVGTLLTAGGVTALYWRPSTPHEVMRAAALFALGAAVLRALISVIGKFGLEVLPNPMMGVFVAYAVSTIAAWMIFGIRSRSALPRFSRAGLLWFVSNGVISAVAAASFFFALFVGQVVVVTPIVSTTPLFTMLTAMVFGADHLPRRVVFSVPIVVLGIVLVSLGRL
jgi:uncharacterized membrane protein